MNSSSPRCGARLSAGETLRQMWQFVNEHEVLTRASAIAFSCISAAVPMLVVLLLVLVQLLPNFGSSVTGDRQGLGMLMLQQVQLVLQSMFPPEAYKVVQEQIQRIQTSPPVGIMGIGVVLALWTASSVFRAAISAMNIIYGVAERRSFWRVWLLSMWMTIVQTGIVVGGLLLVIAWPYFLGKLGISDEVWILSGGVRWLIITTVVLASFHLTFRMGPDVPQRHHWVTPGSIFGTLFFFGTCWGLKIYVQHFTHYDATYGSLAGVMIMLLWFYSNALVFLMSAEINRLSHFAAARCAATRESDEAAE